MVGGRGAKSKNRSHCVLGSWGMDLWRTLWGAGIFRGPTSDSLGRGSTATMGGGPNPLTDFQDDFHHQIAEIEAKKEREKVWANGILWLYAPLKFVGVVVVSVDFPLKPNQRGQPTLRQAQRDVRLPCGFTTLQMNGKNLTRGSPPTNIPLNTKALLCSTLFCA